MNDGNGKTDGEKLLEGTIIRQEGRWGEGEVRMEWLKTEKDCKEGAAWLHERITVTVDEIARAVMWVRAGAQ